MSAKASASASNVQGVFVYMGQGSVLPRDVTRVYVYHSVRVISARAFDGCYKLVEVELSQGLEEIGDWAFCDCKSLWHITIPFSVRVIVRKAFERCHELVEVELCGGLKEIGKYAFAGCFSLKRIAVPSTTTKYHRYTARLPWNDTPSHFGVLHKA